MFHPKLDEHGKPVKLLKPSPSTPTDSWTDKTAFAQVSAGAPVPRGLLGLPFSTWVDAPTTRAGWEALDKKMSFDEPHFEPKPGRKAAAGVVIVESDGRVWAIAPTNAFGGYNVTFPKGRLDGLSTKAAAVKEAYEEAGLRVELSAYLMDSTRTTSYTRYYLAKRIGGSPGDMGWEAQAVMLVPMADLEAMITHHSDKPILKALSSALVSSQSFSRGH